MGINNYKKGIKQRREERLRLLKAKKRRLDGEKFPTSLTANKREYHEESSYWLDQVQDKGQKDQSTEFRITGFGGKTIATFLLVLVVYVVMNSGHPQLQGYQSYVETALTEDFNLDPVLSWYEETWGSTPAFLPEVIQREGPDEQQEYVVPVSEGAVQVVAPFEYDQQGITVEGTGTMPVEAVKEGWVTHIEEGEQGVTVRIDHGQDEESWYGRMEVIEVELHDWVQQGEVIGTTAVDEEGEALFYFALRQNETFIDPLDVMTFD